MKYHGHELYADGHELHAVQKKYMFFLEFE